MPNTVKKAPLPQESDTAAEAEMDDFDFESLDDLASFMVEALTIPLPSDFRSSEGSAVGSQNKPMHRPAKRLN